MTAHFLLTSEALDEQAVESILESEGAGAIVKFVGRVRAHSRGRCVTKLEYEAYPEMAEGVFVQIADEMRARGAIIDVAIHHRVGTLQVGEVSVVIAVSAAHRAPAFDACRYAIDRLKAARSLSAASTGPIGSSRYDTRAVQNGFVLTNRSTRKRARPLATM